MKPRIEILDIHLPSKKILIALLVGIAIGSSSTFISLYVIYETPMDEDDPCKIQKLTVDFNAYNSGESDAFATVLVAIGEQSMAEDSFFLSNTHEISERSVTMNFSHCDLGEDILKFPDTGGRDEAELFLVGYMYDVKQENMDTLEVELTSVKWE
jgi:hypothetical protein|tara:strand:+ start:2126 stop:2590 length:465 start_codon:yes stop_codon:yes gene_type:complete